MTAAPMVQQNTRATVSLSPDLELRIGPMERARSEPFCIELRVWRRQADPYASEAFAPRGGFFLTVEQAAELIGKLMSVAKSAQHGGR